MWRAETMSVQDEQSVAQTMASARAKEHQAIAVQAGRAMEGSVGEQRRALRRLRLPSRRSHEVGNPCRDSH